MSLQDTLIEIQRQIQAIERRLGRLEAQEMPGANPIRRTFTVTLVDNIATPVFTITTTTGEGGAYSCCMHMVAVNGFVATPQTAAKGLTAQFARVMNSAGSGVNTAVTEDVETASAATDAATRDVGTLTVTVAETSELVQTVSVLADHTGSGAAALQAVVVVELVWARFTAPPVLAAAAA